MTRPSLLDDLGAVHDSRLAPFSSPCGDHDWAVMPPSFRDFSLRIPTDPSKSPGLSDRPILASCTLEPSYHLYPHIQSGSVMQETRSSTLSGSSPWNGGCYHPGFSKFPPGWMELGEFSLLVGPSSISSLLCFHLPVPDAHTDHLSQLFARNPPPITPERSNPFYAQTASVLAN